MIKINMFSHADSVQGQGVGSAYKELIRLLDQHLKGTFKVTVNEKQPVDLTHYHTINPSFYLNSFSRKRGRKIGYVHFLPETLEGSIKLPWVARKVFYKYVVSFYKRMDQIVVVNPIFIDKLTQYGIAREKIKYIPNFVTKDVFYEKSAEEKVELRKAYNIDQDKFIVFGDGQVQQRKGVLDFVKLAQQNPDLQFIWAGGFSFGKITDGYEQLNKVVKNPPKNLIFTGIIPRDQLVDYLNMANLFLLPSFDELFPMSVLEAFSTGTPVMLRDLELYRAVIDGYYESCEDSDEMQAKIRELVHNQDRIAELKSFSKTASDRYSEANLTKIWKQFYEEQYEIAKENNQSRG
ncbi:glycosyltransferase family 4 protein [Holzapfeliella floricola]|uniref:Glycosyl transferase CpoA n=1 Tax=Holzapfeliella floricola DSM 23037 = JCM 16512 TaxID=1423744 RepID=A0A0R2DTX1_9LACO|nr:glycosyltransferase family 4 protein [Holzapfeliella floricola]KRN04391.1 glycosyl transferase CpoA [Holzapfeliella floricola DSM 23037 = JCM 16512]